MSLIIQSSFEGLSACVGVSVGVGGYLILQKLCIIKMILDRWKKYCISHLLTSTLKVVSSICI